MAGFAAALVRDHGHLIISTFQPPDVFKRMPLLSGPDGAESDEPPPRAANVSISSVLALRISRLEMFDSLKLHGKTPEIGTRLPSHTYSPVNAAPGVPES